jgi:hypothetical protein
MSDVVLKDINVNSSSGQKIGKEKLFSFFEGSGHKELNAMRSKAVDYSNAPIVSSTDISRLGINKELGNYPQRNLSSLTSMKNDLRNREQGLVDEINRLRRVKEEILSGYEFISELEKVKRYTVNSNFVVMCIDEYNQNKLYDLNNNQIEEEEYDYDDNDNGAAQMGDLDINGEHQHA